MCVGKAPLPDLSYKTVVSLTGVTAATALFSRKLVAGLLVVPAAPLKEWSLLASIAIIGVVGVVGVVALLVLVLPLPLPHLGRLRQAWVLLVCTVLLPPLVMVVVTVVVTRVRLGKNPAMRFVVGGTAVDGGASVSADDDDGSAEDMLARRCPTGRSGGTANPLAVFVIDDIDVGAAVAVVVVLSFVVVTAVDGIFGRLFCTAPLPTLELRGVVVL
jgi:hypothetical protein